MDGASLRERALELVDVQTCNCYITFFRRRGVIFAIVLEMLTRLGVGEARIGLNEVRRSLSR